jgi:hypothetical protein
LRDALKLEPNTPMRCTPDVGTLIRHERVDDRHRFERGANGPLNLCRAVSRLMQLIRKIIIIIDIVVDIVVVDIGIAT